MCEIFCFVCFQIIEEGDDEDIVEEEAPEDQEGAQFGWFNDIYIFDPGKSQMMTFHLSDLSIIIAGGGVKCCAMVKTFAVTPQNVQKSFIALPRTCEIFYDPQCMVVL